MNLDLDPNIHPHHRCDDRFALSPREALTPKPNLHSHHSCAEGGGDDGAVSRGEAAVARTRRAARWVTQLSPEINL